MVVVLPAPLTPAITITRACRRQAGQARAGRSQQCGDFRCKRGAQFGFVQILQIFALAQGRHNFTGRLDPKVGHNQQVFQRIQLFGGKSASAQQPAKTVAQRLARPAQAGRKRPNSRSCTPPKSISPSKRTVMAGYAYRNNVARFGCLLWLETAHGQSTASGLAGFPRTYWRVPTRASSVFRVVVRRHRAKRRRAPLICHPPIAACAQPVCRGARKTEKHAARQYRNRDKCQRVFEHGSRFGGKARNDVGAEAISGRCAFSFSQNDRLLARMAALHAFQNHVVTGLQRQMKMRHQTLLMDNHVKQGRVYFDSID